MDNLAKRSQLTGSSEMRNSTVDNDSAAAPKMDDADDDNNFSVPQDKNVTKMLFKGAKMLTDQHSEAIVPSKALGNVLVYQEKKADDQHGNLNHDERKGTLKITLKSGIFKNKSMPLPVDPGRSAPVFYLIGKQTIPYSISHYSAVPEIMDTTTTEELSVTKRRFSVPNRICSERDTLKAADAECNIEPNPNFFDDKGTNLSASNKPSLTNCSLGASKLYNTYDSPSKLANKEYNETLSTRTLDSYEAKPNISNYEMENVSDEGATSNILHNQSKNIMNFKENLIHKQTRPAVLKIIPKNTIKNEREAAASKLNHAISNVEVASRKLTYKEKDEIMSTNTLDSYKAKLKISNYEMENVSNEGATPKILYNQIKNIVQTRPAILKILPKNGGSTNKNEREAAASKLNNAISKDVVASRKLTNKEKDEIMSTNTLDIYEAKPNISNYEMENVSNEGATPKILHDQTVFFNRFKENLINKQTRPAILKIVPGNDRIVIKNEPALANLIGWNIPSERKVIMLSVVNKFTLSTPKLTNTDNSNYQIVPRILENQGNEQRLSDNYATDSFENTPVQILNKEIENTTSLKENEMKEQTRPVTSKIVRKLNCSTDKNRQQPPSKRSKDSKILSKQHDMEICVTNRRFRVPLKIPQSLVEAGGFGVTSSDESRKFEIDSSPDFSDRLGGTNSKETL